MSHGSAGAGGGGGGCSTSSSSNGHKRQSKSCKRCLKRKKRCYGFPICTNCERANEPCEQSPFAVQLHQRDDNYAAMQRIRTLEAQLESAHAELASVRRSQRQQDLACFASPDSSRRPSQTPTTDGQPSRSHTVEPSPGPESTEGTESTGDLPPFPLLEHMVQKSVWRKLLPPASDRENMDLQRGLGMPTDAAGLCMVQAYLDNVHTQYPILSPSHLLRLHAQRHQISGAVGELNAFRLYMVYAIGGAQQRRQQQPGGRQPGDRQLEDQQPPEDYYEAALSHLWTLQQLPPLASVEALLLLLLYGLQSPPASSTAVWQVAGLAMRICIDLGLHREASYADSPKREQHQRRRLFWTAFCLDYSIALWLRRPLSLTRRDMDTRPPGPHDDSVSVDRDEDMDSPADLAVWARFVQLRQLEAHIYTDLYALNEPLKTRFGRVRPHLQALDTWLHELQASAATAPDEAEAVYGDFWLLWNRAVLVLLRPFLLVMHPDDDGDDGLLIARCLQAAGHVSSAVRHMQQCGLHIHALSAAQSAFNAGITIW